MFIRVDNLLINLDELQSAQIMKDRGTGNPLLKMNFKRGRTVFASSEASPILLYDVIVEALAAEGELYNPAQDPDPEIELSEDTEAYLRQLHDGGYSWIARDKDGKLFAYRDRPVKVGAYWSDPHTAECICITRTNTAADEDLDGEDVPLNIMELLLGT